MKRRSVIFGACSALVAAGAVTMRPHIRASELLAPIDLDKQVPLQFGRWTIDRAVIPVLPDPSVQAKLSAIYTQVLARTYVSPDGLRVMLSIAYGADQGSDATSAHRPEFCYAAQGFSVVRVGDDAVPINGQDLAVRRLISKIGSRFEPITYWVTLNDRTVLPGLVRKVEQIRLGLLGQIPDGMLMRTSTVGLETAQSFAVQDQFLRDLNAALQPQVRSRYFGSAA